MNGGKSSIQNIEDIYLKILGLFVFFIGCIFVLSFILKTYQINDFFVLISKYNFIKQPYLIKLIAYVVLFIEGLIGVALISKYRQKTLVLASSIGILFVFSITIMWGLKYGEISDCGCFSSLIKMSPEESIIKNIIMIILLFTYWGNIKGWFKRSFYKVNIIAISMIIISLCGIIILNNKAYPQTDSLMKYKQFIYLGENIEIDFSKGLYLIIFVNPTCDKCKEEIDNINQLNKKNNSIVFIAFIQINEGNENEFFTAENVSIPYQLIKEEEFRKYIKSTPPQIYLLKDGKMIKSWAEMPSFEEITSYF